MRYTIGQVIVMALSAFGIIASLFTGHYALSILLVLCSTVLSCFCDKFDI